MAVADMVAEWFESEPLKATLAASGILGSFLGPASAGSTAVMMLLGAAGGEAVATGWSAVGGPQSVSDALAAAAQACRGCDLWERATQAVMGSGPEDARTMFVGEQPGDREDIEGEPFVGPAARAEHPRAWSDGEGQLRRVVHPPVRRAVHP